MTSRPIPSCRPTTNVGSSYARTAGPASESADRSSFTDGVRAFTEAAVFQPGTTTETVIRFSAVAGERDSPDTWRAPRGWALKFYTTEGNYGIVGNNIPVFFVGDPLKFGCLLWNPNGYASASGARIHLTVADATPFVVITQCGSIFRDYMDAGGYAQVTAVGKYGLVSGVTT